MKRVLSIALVLVLALALFAGCGEKKNAGYAFATENFGEDLYVIGIRKGEDALTEKINATLETLKDNGKAAEISNNWFAEDILVKDDSFKKEAVATDGSWDYIKQRGKLIVGLDDTFAPMGFRDEAGKLVGFDIDLANALGKELGVEIVFQPIDWDAKEMELNNKNIDCIWNGMSATPARRESMNLSNPYLNNVIVIMTMEGSQIVDKATLAGKTVGTQADSAALEVVKADPCFNTFEELVEYPTYDEAMMDMEAGRIDAIIVDQVLGMYKASQK